MEEERPARARIWSGQRGLWWRPDASGYTSDGAEAGKWTMEDAERLVRSCSPDKQARIVPAIDHVHRVLPLGRPPARPPAAVVVPEGMSMPPPPEDRDGGWRDIATAPRDGAFIMVCTAPGHGVPAVQAIVPWHGGAVITTRGLRDATHWRPLLPFPRACRDTSATRTAVKAPVGKGAAAGTHEGASDTPEGSEVSGRSAESTPLTPRQRLAPGWRHGLPFPKALVDLILATPGTHGAVAREIGIGASCVLRIRRRNGADPRRPVPDDPTPRDLAAPEWRQGKRYPPAVRDLILASGETDARTARRIGVSSSHVRNVRRSAAAAEAGDRDALTAAVAALLASGRFGNLLAQATTRTA